MEFLRFRLEDILLENIGRMRKSSMEMLIQKYLNEPVPLEVGKLQRKDYVIRKLIVDACMENEEYEKAVTLYTKFLQECPAFSKSSIDYYICRSKALEKLAHYEESILDIDRALELPLPTNLQQQLEKSKARIKSKMSNGKAAEANHKSATKSYYEIPSLSHGESDDIPGCSSAISAKYDREHGCHFVAQKPIKLGDVILVEKPVIVFPLPNEDEVQLCYNCMKYSNAPIPCDFCSFALFCCKECREEAYEKYHRIECTFGICSCQIKPAIRLLLKLTDNGARLNEAIEYCKKLDALDKDSPFNNRTSDKLIGNDIESVLNLSCPMQEDDEYERQVHAAASATMLRNYSNIMHGSNDILDLAKLMYRLLYIVGKRNLTISPVNSKDLQGLGIYPLFELIYHSCCANTIFSIQKYNVLVLRATKDINPDDVITFNFLEEAIKVPTPIRRDIVLQRRNIVCRCGACMANYTFMPELRRKIDIPTQLKRRLRKCPIDVPSMWELLKLINNDIKRPCLEIELMKIAIRNAYMQKESPVIWTLYNGLGVF